MGDIKVGQAAEAAANKLRYKLFALYGDQQQHLYAGNSDDEAEAIANAIRFDAVDIYGRVIVQDTTTGEIVAAFQDGKPLDPRELDS